MYYDTAKIRQFFFEKFSDTELKIFCFDYFLDVSHDFTETMTKSQKIQLLLEHCQKDRERRMPNLLAALQAVRPEQYREAFPTPLLTEPLLPLAARNPRQIFISYAHQNATFAHRLADDLQQQDWTVWIAPESIRPGEKWQNAINRGLEESGIFVLVLTPSAVNSQWVCDETEAAIILHRQGKIEFIPLLVQPCQPPPLWSIYQHIPFDNDYTVGLQVLFDRLGTPYEPPPKSSIFVKRLRFYGKKWGNHFLRRRWGVAALLLVLLLWGTRSMINNIEPDEIEPTQIASLSRQLHTPLAPMPTTFTPSLPSTAAPNPTPTATLTPTPDANFPPVNPELGDRWIRPKDDTVMVFVPGETFLMGSDIDSYELQLAESNELPQHSVTLDSFWIDQTEVTNAQYSKCVAARACTVSLYVDEADFNGEEFPVVGISWEDATDYCTWVGGQLPTEAQWEFTARGPENNIFPWGDQLPTNCTAANLSDCVMSTNKVGSYSPSGDSWVGAVDMAGNVWEWVNDWYQSDYYESTPTHNPTGPSDTRDYKVQRGGSWGYPEFWARSAYRGYGDPMERSSLVGFRCVVLTNK